MRDDGGEGGAAACASVRHKAVGELRELSEAKWASGMRGWAGKGIHGGRDAGASEVEVVGQRLVGLEVGDGSGSAGSRTGV